MGEATRKIMEGIDKKDNWQFFFLRCRRVSLWIRMEKHFCPAMIWADLRAEEQARQLAERVGEDRMYELNGHRVSASYSIEKLMWIRDHEPRFMRIHIKCFLAKDYIICRLTGEFVTDYSRDQGQMLLIFIRWSGLGRFWKRRKLSGKKCRSFTRLWT